MLALSIRQPYAELILRGIKKIEYRSRPTRIVNEALYIYASRGRSQKPGARRQKSDALTLPSPGGRGELPTGVLVGTAVISRCERNNGHYDWHLKDAKRLQRPRKPKKMPQPVWFNPF